MDEQVSYDLGCAKFPAGQPPCSAAIRVYRIRGAALKSGSSPSETKQAKRYFVSGMVQGVGYRYYTLAAAEKLRVSGFVRNLSDGRVEVFAVGTPQQHRELRTMLERGPRFSSVSEVREEPAISDAQDRAGFFIDHSD